MRIVPESKRHVKTGDKFGRLTIIGEPFYVAYRQTLQHVVCECECGQIKAAELRGIVSGKSVSCGCWKRSQGGERTRTHGQSGTRLHKIWKGMRKRCTNPNHPIWKHYGGKGIRVCQEWSDFAVFREWAMSHGYEDTLTIERENNDKGYSPDNCRWATHAEQMRNTSRNRFLTAFGETKCLSEWYRDSRLVVSADGLEKRINRGMDLETAMLTPAKGTKSKAAPANPA